MNNIVLCGFMGCGKSSVGKIIASRLGKEFIDTDAYIEQSEGMTVSQIFADAGEAAFRDIEHKACTELARQSGLVIATGGGALTFERNRSAFGADTVIFMDVTFDEINQRIGGCGGRPLFRDANKARELYEQRLPAYRAAADITVDAGGSAEAAADRIIDAINSEESE